MTHQPRPSRSWTILGVIWLVSAIGDRLWFAIDKAVPSWDQADYLTGALNYWQAFQTPQWGNGDWWTSLWQLSSKIPPGVYIITAIFHSYFGLGEDIATLVNLFFSAILLVSVYGLGSRCFNQKVGLWAAGLCMLFPGLYHVRLDFLLDYPLTAAVTLCFYCLTLWKYPPEKKREERGERGEERKEKREKRRENLLYPLSSLLYPLFSFLKLGLASSPWGMAFAFGLSLGLALMIKQTTVLFLFAPILWVVVGSVWRREWGKLAQLALANLLALAVMYPWYRTNWLLILTGSKRATIDSAIAEGDPPLNTLKAWTYYLEQLPHHVSLPILIVASAGFCLHISLYIIRKAVRKTPRSRSSPVPGRPPVSHFIWRWLLVFWLGAYLLCSLNINKDSRYVLPYLPVVAIFLANGLVAWQSATFNLQTCINTKALCRLKSRLKKYRIASKGKGSSLQSTKHCVPCAYNISYHISYHQRPLQTPFGRRSFLGGEEGVRSLFFFRPPRSGGGVPAGTVAVAFLLMVVNLWPVDDPSRIYPRQPGQQHAYTGPVWPIREVIAEIIQTEPFTLSPLGVLPSTPTVNQHTLNYYGALANFQVYGRQVGVRRSQVAQDVRSLNWFLTKTGDQGSVPVEAQAATVQAVQTSPDFQLHKTWPLPDGSTLQLYHRQSPSIQVKPQAFKSRDNPPSQMSQVKLEIKLENVIVPPAAPPGQPIPVTYQWLGNWQDLQNGLVLLTWEEQPSNQSTANNTANNHANYWLHDHGIGLGKLHGTVKNSVAITETLAMLPPGNIAPGIYTLKAEYLNRQTGETYPLEVPSSLQIKTQIKIDPTAEASPAPELDLVTQLRSLATALPLGVDALGPVFDDIGRINQYDPTQDYLTQAELTLKARLSRQDNLALAYNLALAMVLKRDAPGAIAALEKVVQLDPKNPYAHGYLAFVNLYDWRPGAAEKALKPALKIDPNRREFQILNALAALFQGNLRKAWHRAYPLLFPANQPNTSR